MKTYKQWVEYRILERMEEYDIPRQAASEGCLEPRDWWEAEILPALESGEVLTKIICRSIVRNGGGMGLPQISKHFENQVPKDILWETGMTLKRGY